jgi:ankyrin repeat protein
VYVSRGDKGEHPERVSMLLHSGADVNARGPNGATALHVAARAGFASVLQVLLENGAEVNVRTDDGSTALKLALKARRTEAAKVLERHGAAV